MSGYEFEWDEVKAKTNIKKHGVSFEEAKSVFFDEFGRLISDPDSSVGEERFILLGQTFGMRTLVVCHCYRGVGDRIRILSARKADQRERREYERFQYA